VAYLGAEVLPQRVRQRIVEVGVVHVELRVQHDPSEGAP